MNKPGMRESYLDWVIPMLIGLFFWTVIALAVVGTYYLVRWTT